MTAARASEAAAAVKAAMVFDTAGTASAPGAMDSGEVGGEWAKRWNSGLRERRDRYDG